MLVNFTFDSKSDNKSNDDERQLDYQKRLYDKYSADRGELSKNALEVGGRYDKAVFLLSAGSLALSLTFIEKIAPEPTLLSAIYLGAAWLCFVITLILSLLATSKSQSAIQWQIEQLDIQYRAILYPETEGSKMVAAPSSEAQNPHVAHIRFMDTAARVILVYGMICLCAFALLNVEKKEQTDASKTVSTSALNAAAREGRKDVLDSQ